MRTLRINCILILVMIMFTACYELSDIIVDIPPPTPSEIPPFVITRPEFEIIGRPYYFNYAGIVFNFLNQADNIVEKITVSFRLFDARTQDNPFIGSNLFQITVGDIIHPNENKEIIISLDRFIHIAPSWPYIIDSFYISQINYVGGRIWEDKYGKFRVRD